MCKFDKRDVMDENCLKQYVVTCFTIDGEYAVVCNVNDDGTTDVIPVNDKGKVCAESLTFRTVRDDGKPTYRMVNHVLNIDPRFDRPQYEYERIG